MMSERSKTTKAALMVMAATLISKILGFLREILLGSTYGATYVTDAYLIAMIIPTILFFSFVTAIATTYIPVYTKVRLEKGNDQGIRFTSKILSIVVVTSIILTIAGWIFAKPIVSVIGMGFDTRTFDLAVELTKIILPAVIFIGITYIFMGFLQSNEEFFIPALINVPNNIIVITVLSFSGFFGIYGLAFATLLGYLFQSLIQYPFVRKKGYRYTLLLDFKDSYVKEVWSLALPVLIGMSVQQLNTLIDRMLASGLVEGSISALNFANKLNGFVYGIFSVSISTVIYPLLSKLNAENNKEMLKKTIVSSINVITLLMVPITVGAVILRIPIVSILFERGNFDNNATMLTSSALLFYSLGMVFFGYRDVLSRVFYSLQDTKTPMVNGGIALLANIVLNLILVRYMQHAGLALATSIASAVTTILLFWNLRRKMGNIGGTSIAKVVAKSGIAALLMGVTIYYFNMYLSNVMNNIIPIMYALRLFLTIGIGTVIYCIIIYIFKIEEINWIVKLIKNRLVLLR